MNAPHAKVLQCEVRLTKSLRIVQEGKNSRRNLILENLGIALNPALILHLRSFNFILNIFEHDVLKVLTCLFSSLFSSSSSRHGDGISGLFAQTECYRWRAIVQPCSAALCLQRHFSYLLAIVSVRFPRFYIHQSRTGSVEPVGREGLFSG